MRAGLAIVAAFATATIVPIVGAKAGVGVSSSLREKPDCYPELQLAKKYADLREWKDAEVHFAAAAAAEPCQQESLAGIQAARSAQDAKMLEPGQIYESEHQWAKAEDLYKAVALDVAVGDPTRKIAGDRLRTVLEAQDRERRWSKWRDSVTEWIKDAAAIIVFLVSLTLLIFTIKSVWSGRRVILIHRFDAPTEELTKGLNIQLRYARITMNDPAFSRAAQMPPFLVENLRFFDEVDPIEDLEVAGSKIPFAALGKLFGRPEGASYRGL